MPLIALPLVARHVAVEQYGIYLFSTSLATWFSLVLDYGFSISGTRDIASTTSTSEMVRVFVRIQSAKIILAASLIPVCVGAYYVLDIFRGNVAWIVAAWVLSSATGLTPTYFLQGKEWIVKAATAELVASMFFLLFVWMAIKGPATFDNLVWCLVLPRLGVMVYSFLVVGKTIDHRAFFKVNVADGKAALFESFTFFSMQLAVSLYSSLNTVFVGYFCGPKEISAFGASERLIRTAAGVIGQISMALFPRINITKVQSPQNLAQVRFQSAIYVGVAAIGATVVSLFFADVLAHYFNPKNEEQTAQLLRIMSVSLLWVGANNIMAYQFLVVDKREGVLNRITLACALVHLIGVFIGAKLADAQGVAYAWVATETLIGVACFAAIFNPSFGARRV